MVESKPDQQIGYILRSYPRLSQTFVLNEILALERLGVDLAVFAVANPREAVVQPQAAQVRARVRYLSGEERRAGQPSLAERRQTMLNLGPRYLRALLYVVQNSEIDRGYTAANRMACFYQAVHLVQLLEADRRRTGRGVAHLHAHFAHDPALIAQIAHLLTGIPYSFTAHARDLLQVPRNVLRERIRQASAVVTCCRTNLDYLEALAPDERHKFSLVYHGVNLEGFQPASPAAQPGEPPLVLSVGRLVEKKGYLDLFEALRRVKDGGGRFRCEIYGDGPQRAELEERLAALGLAGDVLLAGTRTQAELIPIYQRAALFALAPTVTEDGDRDGIPNALAEAMAVGLPVVATRVGGIPEIVNHGREGLLYTPHDAAGLAGGIAALLSSEPLRRALGQAARRQVCEHFDLAQAALRLKDLFARVLSPAAFETGDAAALPQVPVTYDS